MNVISRPSCRTPMKKVALAVISAMSVLGAGLTLAQNNLLGVSLTNGKQDSQVVKVQMKSADGAMPVAFTTTNPPRLVLDFADTTNAAGKQAVEVNGATVKSYRVVQSGERTRLVIDLTSPAAYEVKQNKDLIYAVLTPVAQVAEAAPAAKEAAKATGQSVRDVEFRRGKDGEGVVVVTFSHPGVAVDVQKKNKAIQIDFPGVNLPAPLQRRLDVTDFATPAQSIEAFAQDKSSRMVIHPRGNWDYAAYQTGDQLFVEVKPLQMAANGGEAKPQYTGKKIELDLQKMELRQLIHILAEEMGVNVVMSDSLAGDMTLKLKNVHADQALDIVLEAKNLGKGTLGENTLWIAPQQEIDARREAKAKSQKTLEDLVPTVTRSYKLNYVRADEALSVISGLSRARSATVSEDATCSPSSTGIKADSLTGGAGGTTGTSNTGAATASTQRNLMNSVLSTRGGGSHDLTTNTLVVTDTPDRHAEVERVLAEIDIPTRQVMIEARIVFADDSFGRDLGAKLGLHSVGTPGGTTIGVSNTGTNARGLATGTAVTSQTGYNVQLPTAAGVPNAGTLGMSILNAAANTLLSLELQALEQDNRGRIVSNPRVVTTNLKPAVILQGSQIPYQTVSDNGTETEFKDALLCLLVAPQILNNDSVILNVEVQQDAQGVDTDAGPAINVRRVKTQVRVNNGETAVLGGIFEQITRNDTSKVPLLGDLPILGNLFRSNSKMDEKTELLIFLTPRLLDDRISTSPRQ
mgnify:CR=1 FL=1